MSKKEIFTKNLVTPKEALSKCFRIGALVYFKDGSYVVKKSDQSDFAMTVGCLLSKEADDLFQIIDINKPYPTAHLSIEYAVEDFNDNEVIYNNTSTTLRTILKASKFGNCQLL